MRPILSAAALMWLGACADYQKPQEIIVGPDRQLEIVTNYSLVFRNFSLADMQTMEEYLQTFSGYLDHRTEHSGANHEVSYESTLGQGQILRNLVRAANGMRLDVKISLVGNKYIIDSTGWR